MLKSTKYILALVFIGVGLTLTGCNKGASQQPSPPPPQCVPGQVCNITQPNNPCPFGQYWNGTSCVNGNHVPGGGYKQYFANLNISNKNASEDIIEGLTGQYFCFGSPTFCPNASQGAVEIVVFGNGFATVRLNLGGQNNGAVFLMSQAPLRNINNDAGSEIDVLLAGTLDFKFITKDYRLDLGGTKDGTIKNTASLQVLYRNNGFATGTLTKYGY